MKIIRIEDLDKTDLVIKWRCTYDCNYKCSYCYQNNACNKNIHNLDYSQIADDIKDLIARSNAKTVKLLMIGGEVTLLPLLEIIPKIDNLTCLHLTTNFHKDADFFNALADFVELDLCCSFHHEYVTPEDFVAKVLKLNNNISVKVEMVQNDDTIEYNEKVIQLCEKNNISYQVDLDRNLKYSNENQIKSKKADRLKVYFDDGKVKVFQNKTDIYTDKDIDAYHQRYIPTKGLLCSENYDYIYIRGHAVFSLCNKKYIQLKDWIPQKKRCTKDGCTLCGRINLTL